MSFLLCLFGFEHYCVCKPECTLDRFSFELIKPEQVHNYAIVISGGRMLSTNKEDLHECEIYHRRNLPVFGNRRLLAENEMSYLGIYVHDPLGSFIPQAFESALATAEDSEA